MPAESILPAGFDVQDIDSHTVRALLASRALLVKIKRDLENHVRGLLKNLGLVIGRAKFNVFADVVEELSKNDEPLKQVRTQNVAVLFVHIVGFTAFADARTPEEVVRTLREFHALMEQEVFRHSGTLDKYLGDGLMATFGTPFTGKDDASNALRCAQAMMAAVDRWNGERKAAGEPPIRVSFGLHYGPVVLGDIGLTCLEFAVIGSTVNAARARRAGYRSNLASALPGDGSALQGAINRADGHAGARDGALLNRRSATIRRCLEPCCPAPARQPRRVLIAGCSFLRRDPARTPLPRSYKRARLFNKAGSHGPG